MTMLILVVAVKMPVLMVGAVDEAKVAPVLIRGLIGRLPSAPCEASLVCCPGPGFLCSPSPSLDAA